ncbi:MAG: aspartate kinase [Rikenellaceae bacterium]|nr:aspartate kinase [Rikenellaceae bacterium]
MLTIPNAVEEVVKNKPFLEGALIEGLINLSALARSIKTEVESRVGKDVTESAIVMALNRLVPKLEQTTRLKVQQIIDNMGDIIVRSSLTDYTFANSQSLHSCQEKLLSHIDSLNPNKDIFCTVSQGINETTLVVSSQIADLVDSIFARESVISRTESLSSITIKLPSENAFCPGVYYHIFKELAWENINIKEIISTTNEFTVVVSDKDIQRAFTILMSTKRGYKM